jgi:hypothetical protein
MFTIISTLVLIAGGITALFLIGTIVFYTVVMLTAPIKKK